MGHGTVRMSAPFFFKSGQGLTVGAIAALTGAAPRPGHDLDRHISGIAALDRASPRDLVFLEGGAYADQAAATDAGACLTVERLADRVNKRACVLCTNEPYRAFIEAASALFPDALRPSSLFESEGSGPGTFIHPAARLESGVAIDPGAVIGPCAELGCGTVIGAGAAIGFNVRIGRDCSIGPNVSITNALIGDRVIIHPGCSVGQDGFGFVMGA